MRILLVLAASLVGCSSGNVQPLEKFGPISAWIDVELGPFPADGGLDVNPRVFVSFDHNNPACPVFDNDIDVSLDGVRPDELEVGYYDEGGGWGHDTGPSCQPPYFSIYKVPPAKPLSMLRLRDATADFSFGVDRLFVNPPMTIATPLSRGQVARIEVADDRRISKVSAIWWIGDSENATGYDTMATISSNSISLHMPTQLSGPGWLEVHAEVEAPSVACNGFSECSVLVNTSARLEGTLL
ncbi:MAG TPA: hypothetical protein VL326_19280 [Kofleriaceae bacterium]|nr:hypothetical protein [Kofleriaceae bacterium]